MNDVADLASNLEPRLTRMNNQDWENRVASMRDDADVYSAARNGIDAVALTNWLMKLKLLLTRFGKEE